MLADKTYNFDLPTLFRLLRDQSAVLSTEVNVSHVRGLCYGYLFLRKRTILDCQIQSQDGTVLYTGQEAYTILSTKKQWQVRIDDGEQRLRVAQEMLQGKEKLAQEIPRRNGNVSSPIPGMYVPRAVAVLESPVLDKYTMKQRVILRTVFAMINGQRNVAQMKEQLHLSPEAIDEALIALRSIGMIE